MTEIEILMQQEMENIMKLEKIFIGILIAIIVLLLIVLGMQMNNNKSIDYLVNDSLTAKQNQILETYGKVDVVDPNAVKPQVEQALENCKDTNVVNANGKGEEVTEACGYLQNFSDEHYTN